MKPDDKTSPKCARVGKKKTISRFPARLHADSDIMSCWGLQEQGEDLVLARDSTWCHVAEKRLRGFIMPCQDPSRVNPYSQHRGIRMLSPGFAVAVSLGRVWMDGQRGLWPRECTPQLPKVASAFLAMAGNGRRRRGGRCHQTCQRIGSQQDGFQCGVRLKACI